MSAYGHQMERGFSGRSLSSRGGSSRGGSEMGSHHVMEPGFYITSYVATIMISALVIVGVLFISLLISLASMLQSCENRSKGIIEIPKANENYHYCMMYYLHAELNRLEFDDLPEICGAFITQYINGSKYEQDLNITMEIADNYFSGVKPVKDARDSVLIDIDDFIPSSSRSRAQLQYRFIRLDGDNFFKKAKDTRSVYFLRLYTKLQAKGWRLILLSKNPEKERNATAESLISSGYGGWSSLVMRSEDEMEMDNHEYITKILIRTMQQQGFNIAAVISCSMDILTSPFPGSRLFKLPNPIPHAFGSAM